MRQTVVNATYGTINRPCSRILTSHANSTFRSCTINRTKPKQSLRQSVARVASIAKASALSIHCGDTTLTFNLGEENAQQLNEAVNKVIQTFAQKQKAERPQRWPALEFAMKGDADKKEPQYLEVFCNPNAHGTAFEAKVLITLKTADGVKVTTEGKLTAFKADLDTHLG